MPRAVIIKKVDGKPGKVYYPLALTDIPSPEPTSSQISISITAAALNHRDLFIRQHLYPAISFSTPLLADGCGIVSTPSSPLYNKRVILAPSQGWASQVSGPEDPRKFSILGGTSTIPIGTLSEVAVVDENEVELAPEHLSDAEAAALPLTGLTAWRALVTKSGEAEEGRNILVTGIGGGVALMALQFAVAKGCNVYVTSGSEEKIEKAKKMGAKGGVNYKGATWEKDLLKLLPKDRPVFDAIIDGAGGDVIVRGNKLLKFGGTIVSYGMTLGPQISFTMSAVLKNIDVKGSTMGSRAEFAAMVKFVNDKKIIPIVSRVVNGIDNLDAIDGLFQDMAEGKQFGKLVIQVRPEGREGAARL